MIGQTEINAAAKEHGENIFECMCAERIHYEVGFNQGAMWCNEEHTKALQLAIDVSELENKMEDIINQTFEPEPGGIYTDEAARQCAALARDYCKKLESQLEQLRQWKESAVSVMPDMQAIAKLIGVPLGDSIHDKIIPYIKKLQSGNNDDPSLCTT